MNEERCTHSEGREGEESCFATRKRKVDVSLICYEARRPNSMDPLRPASSLPDPILHANLLARTRADFHHKNPRYPPDNEGS